jgi:hypothetical protein
MGLSVAQPLNKIRCLREGWTGITSKDIFGVLPKLHRIWLFCRIRIWESVPASADIQNVRK